MKIPRDLKGTELAKALRKHFGYELTRQDGSHMRLTSASGDHHLTIPNHSPLKVGTLQAILKDLARQLQIPADELLKKLNL